MIYEIKKNGQEGERTMMYGQSIFERMVNIVPEGTSGNVVIKHNTIPYSFAAIMQGITPGVYIGLYVDGGIMMSDTDMEKGTNRKHVDNLQGDILIAGLGVGMVLVPLLRNPEVKSITVVEISQDVINLVYEHIKKLDTENKLQVIKADIFEFVPPTKYDGIYLDIWPEASSDVHANEMKPLKRKFRKYLKSKESYIGVWAEKEARDGVKGWGW